jgi:hypothetical protein
MVDEGGGRRPYPTWVRVLLVGLQAVGIVGGLVLGVLTYDAWSQTDDGRATTTTTVVTPETAVPPDTLG